SCTSARSAPSGTGRRVKVVPVSVRGRTAVRDALLSHGWEGGLASDAVAGADSVALLAEQIPAGTLEAMVPIAARLGLEIFTGPDWLIAIGSRARFGAFARPWLQPEPVQQLATAVGMALPDRTASAWRCGDRIIALDRPVMMGIINVTPDSFAPSSRVGSLDEALDRAGVLGAEGATVIDIGGESTRPGAEPILVEEECRRVIPVIGRIARQHPDLVISVDTVNAETARRAHHAGAVIINDVTAGRHDPALLDFAAESGMGLVLSHSTGKLGTLADLPDHDTPDVTSAVCSDLIAARAEAAGRGAAMDTVVLDPGFGFGKTAGDNWRLLDSLDAVVALGSPVLVGPSRKRFLGQATGRDVEDRDAATAAACALACDRGASLFRVHAPAAARDALNVAAAMKSMR
ncbi:MAG TPA: dihydropteroate synthase, partial [Gemmatimonadales bacterium]|nr:dihydropteroate synthase [Gemmatimonadales bacterium]